MNDTPEHPKPADLWRHRRRMAYSCLFGGLVLIGAFIDDPSRFADSDGFVFPAFMFLGSVLGAYVGFSSYENVKLK